MAYKVAGIDIHKRVLMVVVATAAEQVNALSTLAPKDPIAEGLEFESRRFGTGNSERAELVAWLQEHDVAEVVMESTAQYWRPVWLDNALITLAPLEPHFAKLHLAQAQSNRAPKGRKDDFRDAKRLTRRLLAGELSLSFVPGPEQRTWRSTTRGKLQLIKDRVRLQNQAEALLEEARIKLFSVISDLFGISGRRILAAVAKGETDPVKLAELADHRLKCSKEKLVDALRGSPEPVHLKLLEAYLKRLELLDEQIETLSQMMATELKKHEDAVTRLAQVPELGVDSAQQIIAEVGVDAESFPSVGEFASWIGVCPGENESAEENQSTRSPKGNRFMRRVLTQAAQAAVKKKGCHFQSVGARVESALFGRHSPKLKYQGAIWVVAHRIARLVWKFLHQGITYIEQGTGTDPKSHKLRAQKLIKALKKLGYGVTLPPINPQLAAQSEG